MHDNAGLNSIPVVNTLDGFISECLRALDSTAPATAIYILSCLCPQDSAVILDLARLDLSQPHEHKSFRKKRIHVISSSYADVISQLQAYARNLPAETYGRAWLEVAHRWLLTCPMDEGYYRPDETGKDLFCPKLRSELLDSILNLS